MSDMEATDRTYSDEEREGLKRTAMAARDALAGALKRAADIEEELTTAQAACTEAHAAAQTAYAAHRDSDKNSPLYRGNMFGGLDMLSDEEIVAHLEAQQQLAEAAKQQQQAKDAEVAAKKKEFDDAVREAVKEAMSSIKDEEEQK